MNEHGKSYFYKYVTIEGLSDITSKLSRKWSSPLTFNDPFDTQFDCGFPFTNEEFCSAFLSAREEIIFGDSEPSGDVSHPLYKQLMISRRNRHKQTREGFRKCFEPETPSMISSLQKDRQLASEWWAAQLDMLRVICLSETNTNILMWAHYSQRHTGAVVQLKCARERDSVLLAAVPVIYTDHAPFIADLQGWVRHSTGQEEINYDQHFQRLVATKSTHWKYEMEWRVINNKKKGDLELHMYDSFWPEEIEAVYFGCRADEAKVADILNNMHPALSHVRAFRALKKNWEYGIEFQRIK